MSDQPTHRVSVNATADPEVLRLQFESASRLNTMTVALLRDFRTAVLELRKAPPRALIVSGTRGAFSAGLALDAVLGFDDAAFREMLDLEYDLFGIIERLPFLTIAAIAGPCMGNAAELAMACDYRVAADTVKFGFPEVPVGFMAPTQRITKYLGLAKAKRLLFEGLVLSADQASADDLVDEVVPVDELAERAQSLAERLAKLPPRAIALTKGRLLDTTSTLGRFDASEKSSAFASFNTQDLREGARALLEKRTPTFTGE